MPLCNTFAIMSPFAAYLRELRRSRGLNQKEAARLLGYEQSYLSGLERSAKGPPRRAFTDRLIRRLSLSPAEQGKLTLALARSKRHFSLPCEATAEEYELLQSLAPRLGRLLPVQISLIREALTITAAQSPMTATPSPTTSATTREAAMT